MSHTHHFDIEDANRYGIEQAIFLNYFRLYLHGSSYTNIILQYNIILTNSNIIIPQYNITLYEARAVSIVFLIYHVCNIGNESSLAQHPAAAAQKIILRKLKKILTFRKQNIILHILCKRRWGDSVWFGTLRLRHTLHTKHLLIIIIILS